MKRAGEREGRMETRGATSLIREVEAYSAVRVKSELAGRDGKAWLEIEVEWDFGDKRAR